MCEWREAIHTIVQGSMRSHERCFDWWIEELITRRSPSMIISMKPLSMQISNPFWRASSSAFIGVSAMIPLKKAILRANIHHELFCRFPLFPKKGLTIHQNSILGVLQGGGSHQSGPGSNWGWHQLVRLKLSNRNLPSPSPILAFSERIRPRSTARQTLEHGLKMLGVWINRIWSEPCRIFSLCAFSFSIRLIFIF